MLLYGGIKEEFDKEMKIKNFFTIITSIYLLGTSSCAMYNTENTHSSQTKKKDNQLVESYKKATTDSKQANIKLEKLFSIGDDEPPDVYPCNKMTDGDPPFYSMIPEKEEEITNWKKTSTRPILVPVDNNIDSILAYPLSCSLNECLGISASHDRLQRCSPPYINEKALSYVVVVEDKCFLGKSLSRRQYGLLCFYREPSLLHRVDRDVESYRLMEFILLRKVQTWMEIVKSKSFLLIQSNGINCGTF